MPCILANPQFEMPWAGSRYRELQCLLPTSLWGAALDEDEKTGVKAKSHTSVAFGLGTEQCVCRVRLARSRAGAE